MRCLLRDGSDLLPAWHRLKAGNATAAGRLRGGGTWGHLHVRVPPPPPREGLVRELCAAVDGWMGLAVPGKSDWEGADFFNPLSPLWTGGMVLVHPRP